MDMLTYGLSKVLVENDDKDDIDIDKILKNAEVENGIISHNDPGNFL